MGWLDWERYRCTVDCGSDPGNCIGEVLFREMADKMVEDGYRDAGLRCTAKAHANSSAILWNTDSRGYEYVLIDDCWPLKERNAEGQLVPDPTRFPSGMKALADYVHEKGLKLGIYSAWSNYTWYFNCLALLHSVLVHV